MELGNPGACLSFPGCADMCSSCDIERFNVFADTGIDIGDLETESERRAETLNRVFVDKGTYYIIF